MPDAAGLRLVPLGGLPALDPSRDLAALVAEAAERAGLPLATGDVVVVAQKAVSKVEGRVVALADVEPSDEARAIAADEADPRKVELILRESVAIVRRRGAFLVTETPHGLVCAASGVDLSNAGGDGRAVLLPVDPDASARRLRAALGEVTGADVAVVITDSHGRPFRRGTTGVAIGCAGLAPLVSMAGRPDDGGRPFEGTELHVADQVAAAAELLMGPAGGVPAVLVRGLAWEPGVDGAAATVMPRDRDLFR